MTLVVAPAEAGLPRSMRNIPNFYQRPEEIGGPGLRRGDDNPDAIAPAP